MKWSITATPQFQNHGRLFSLSRSRSVWLVSIGIFPHVEPLQTLPPQAQHSVSGFVITADPRENPAGTSTRMLQEDP